MGTQLVPVDRHASDRLHPAVYGAIIALTAWFVLSVWTLFSGGYASMDNVVITVFFTVLVAIPLVIWLVWRSNRGDDEAAAEASPPLRYWASGEFQSSTGRQKASQAIVEILLPIAAVAIGITIFGLVFRIVALTAA